MEPQESGLLVADFQGVQFMLADMAMRLEAARQLTYAAAAKSERAMTGNPDSDLTFFSSACKCIASDAAMDITTDEPRSRSAATATSVTIRSSG